MASAGFGAVARQVGRLFGGGSTVGLDEGELLRRFASRNDPAAMEALVVRHGPMVLGVCRRVLGNLPDAEDAFQATFLVLAKKAGTIRDPGALGPWLHGVAHRVAIRARANAARRRLREKPGAEDLAMARADDGDHARLERAELRSVLDDAIASLPERFRRPVVLCYLEGLTHDQAAERLGCPVGTVRSRLANARERLRDRLGRRGVTVPAAALASALAAETASAAVPAVLLERTISAATLFAAGGAAAATAGAVPAIAASLAEGMATTMMITKLKVLAGVALAGVLAMGAGGAAVQFAAGSDEPKAGGGSQAGDAKQEAFLKRLNLLKDQLNKVEANLTTNRAARERLSAEAAKLETRSESIRDKLRKTIENGNFPDQWPPLDPLPEMEKGGLTSGEAVPSPANSNIPAAAGGAGGGTGGVTSGPAAMGGGRGMMAGNRPGMMAGGAGIGGAGGNPGGRAGLMNGAGFGGMAAGPNGPDMSYNGRPGGPSGGGGPRAIERLETPNSIIVQKPESRKVFAYNAEAGDWATYDVPEGVKVTPISSTTALVALAVQGKEIRQLAVFVPKQSRWYTLDLKTPIEGGAGPRVMLDLAAYAVGNRVYAFSSTAGKWGTIELEEGAKPVPYLGSNGVIVEHKDHLYVFSSKTGEWSDLDVGAGKVISPEAK